MKKRPFKRHVAVAVLVLCAAWQGPGHAAPKTLSQEGATDAQEVWDGLRQRAGELQEQGKYDEALPLALQALHLAEKTWGSEHLNVAASLNKLAALHASKADFAQAESLFQRSLAIHKGNLGPDHLDVGKVLGSLANLYRDKGDYVKVESLYQRALAIQEKSLGRDHPDVAKSLNNLAVLYKDKGDYAKAEQLYQRALMIFEKALGPAHLYLAHPLNNLAELHVLKGDDTLAEPLFRRSLMILEKSLGTDHLYVAQVLDSLAFLYLREGDFARAEPLCTRSLAIFEKVLGSGHPYAASALNNLAILHRDKGEYARADLLFRRSLTISEKALGRDHPDVARTLSDTTRLAWAQQDFPRALQTLERAASIEEHNLSLILADGSESQKSAYTDTLRSSTNLALSLHLQGISTDRSAARLAATTALRRKGRVLDAMSDGMTALRRHLSEADRGLLDELNSVRSQRAAWSHKGPGDMPTEQYRTRAEQLEAQQQELESRLSARSAAFRELSEPVTVERVQQALPPHAALIEWVVYQPTDPKLAPAAAKAIPRRYAAFVLRSRGDPVWFDLGDAEPIDSAADALRQALAEPDSQDFRLLSRKLHQLVLQPLHAQLAHVRLLLLSPDSELNLVPMGALLDPAGRFLIERHTLNYLTTGRDVLRSPQGRPAASSAVIVAAPEFDVDAPAQLSEFQTPTKRRRSVDWRRETFLPLPATLDEAQAIAGLLPHPTVLTGRAASVQALQDVHSPKILHVATHGFFHPDVGDEATAPKENPLLRSGLVLAGANRPAPDGSDGRLTALEATGLDLYGTELVVLSACETGLGTVRNSEGVYGLRRALTIAGARSQLTSLWLVDDRATRDLMVDYYRRLMRGQGRAQALREVQLVMLRTPALRHPYYWAAFIPVGRWEGL
jgi:CHAT domain-containing protein/Tfp pilus assembly protein PilF